MMAEFHFIRPLWLLAAPALLAIWWIGARATRSSLWEHYIPKNMIEVLRVNQAGSTSSWRWTLLVAWLVLTLAMAGPTWHKTPLPTLTNQQALVLALDLSPSMTAKDLAPNRLTRAQYKMIDILRLRADSQVALIAYAGDAHTVSPLTDDPATIEALLSSLNPGMMPSQGSNTEAAVDLAMQLLDQSNVANGEILLITDGITADAQVNLIAQSNGQHTISILAVGSHEGAPIPAARGGFLKSTNGDIVLASVNHEELASLASTLGGKYTALQNDESDIHYLLTAGPDFNDDQIESDSVVYDSWVDMGHWLVLLILPFAAYCFRKGLIFIIPLTLSVLLFQPQQAQAAWYDQLSLQDLWKTRNQQATELMQEQQFEQAAAKFNDPNWAATAQYRAGQYEQASESFSQQDSLRNLYNTGNSLALQGDLENALEAYDHVLEKDPEHEDAAHNKSIVEQMLAQNQKQSDQQQSQESDEQSEQQDGQPSDQEQESQQPQQSESGQEGEQNQDQQSDQQQAQAQQDGEQEEQDQQQAQTEEQDSKQQSEQEQDSSDETGEQDEEQAAAEQQQQEQADADADQGDQQDESLSGPVREEQEPLQDASEQWLRTIQDDPSGLLKRKFEYQAWQRSQQGQRARQGRRSNQPANNAQQRY